MQNNTIVYLKNQDHLIRDRNDNFFLVYALIDTQYL